MFQQLLKGHVYCKKEKDLFTYVRCIYSFPKKQH